MDDDTGFILHVFNSEYVKENLESVRYEPEDKVSGFILGENVCIILLLSNSS